MALLVLMPFFRLLVCLCFDAYAKTNNAVNEKTPQCFAQYCPSHLAFACRDCAEERRMLKETGQREKDAVQHAVVGIEPHWEQGINAAPQTGWCPPEYCR